MSDAPDYLSPILERKRREVERRKRHAAHARTALIRVEVPIDRGAAAVAALRRESGASLRVIAEIKRRSPSAGLLRARTRGDVAELAQAYARGGAAAVSVLCDGPGFGGSPLDVRRAANAVTLPILFKEFVLDESQIQLARLLGAHMVLLLVRALRPERLRALVDATLAHGLAPVVEAANLRELETALSTRARIVGVNARDLRTFRVDGEAASEALAIVPSDRVAVHMSGVRDAHELARVANGRADAVLIGEGLMRAEDPTRKLRELRGQ